MAKKPVAEGIQLFKKLIFMLFIFIFAAGCSSKTKEDLFSEGKRQLDKGNANWATVLLKKALEKDPNYIDARYALARAYISATKYEQAERELQKVTRQNPSFADLRLDLAKVYTATNKPDMAISSATEYLKSHPNTPEAYEVLGVAQAIGNRLDAAESNLQLALKSDPDRISAKIELAKVYAVSKRVAESKTLLNEIIRKDPNNTKGYNLLASIESSQGNNQEALRIYEKLMVLDPGDLNAAYRAGILVLGKGDVPKASGIADDLIKRFPERSEGHALKGLIEYYGKNYDKAIVALQSSLKFRQVPGTFYYLGLSHYNRKELDLAISQFRKVLELQPGNVQSRLMIALTLLQQKHLDDAATEAGKAVQQDENSAKAHSVLGSVLMAMGKFEEAMAEFNKATELNPRMVDTYLKKGLLESSRGNAAAAETDLDIAVKVAPDVISTRMLLASYLMQQKKYAKALIVFKEGLRGDKEDAVIYNNMAFAAVGLKKESDFLTYLNKAKSANPAFAPAYLNIASYHTSKGNRDKAEAEYQALLKQDPQNTSAYLGLASVAAAKGSNEQVLNYLIKAKETKDPSGYLALATYYRKNNDTAKTLDVLNQAIAAFPNNAAFLELKSQVYLSGKQYKQAAETLAAMEKLAPERALVLQAETYTRMKDSAKAAQAAQKLIAIKPKSAAGYTILAAVHESQNKLPDAVKAIQDGLKIEPGNIGLYMSLGSLQVKMKEYDKAVSTYEEVARKNSTFAEAPFAQGVVYEQTGRKKEATKKYQETLRRSAKHVAALNNLALLYVDGNGDRKEALNLSRKAHELAPNNPGVMETYGYVLHKNGKNGEALRYLEKAATLLPDSPTTLYHLALVQRALGDKAKATETLQKALAKGKFTDVDSARNMLAELKR
jgi:putative PEP-CTERM system TPR-repeat lipoprotein